MNDRSFFVDSRGGSSTSTPTIPTLGHTEFRCHECGHPWELRQENCPKCRSVVFDELVVEPTLLERVGRTIQAAVTPAKLPPPRASVANREALHALLAAVSQLLTDLHALDAELIAAVRADCEELIPIQGAVNTALSITGDRNSRRIAGLSLSLESLRDALTISIQTIEEPR